MNIILQCFLHAWLKIRDRSKHLGQLFFDIGEQVWNVFRAPNKRSCSQRTGVLNNWAEKTLGGVVREKVLDLCGKRKLWTLVRVIKVIDGQLIGIIDGQSGARGFAGA